MRRAWFLAVITLLASSWADEQHHHALTEEELGAVHFATSCSNTVEKDFNHAVALLHSFQYEQARGVFEKVTGQDPQCAMAQWGVAMSHYHGLWGNGDTAAGQAALQRAQKIATAKPATTAREHGYIDALAEVYREDGKDTAAHGVAFAQKMEALRASNPEDSEAAIFYALTLSITAPKTDKTFANQRKCGEVLQPIFEKLPHHPGVAHYLIHCYDNPVLAEQGLVAARTYAGIAPASAHANHMPSHIFTRVGSWDESITSNLKSAVLAAQAEATSTNGEARDQRLHAMDYLEYAYLQSGQLKLATGVLEEMNALPPAPKTSITGDYALSAIPARRALELGDWKAASALQPKADAAAWVQAVTWMAVGIGSARANDSDRATVAVQNLAGLRDALTKQNDTYWSNQVEVQRREIVAWISQEGGKGDSALDTMRSAADLEESMDKFAVTPGAVLPAREMLAQMLLLQKRPKDALQEFATVLKIAPNRFNALSGAAEAAEASGDAAAARLYFAKLVQIGVGNERPELVTARKKVGGTTAGAGGR